jgi:hypothetical protein
MIVAFYLFLKTYLHFIFMVVNWLFVAGETNPLSWAMRMRAANWWAIYIMRMIAR